jgi:hypothetical protein
MTTYTVNFASDAEFASRDFDADTPDQALALARKLYEDDPSALWFEHYDGMDVNEILVYDADGKEVAAWYDDDMRLRLAARDLLDAVKFCAMTLYDLEVSKRKGYITEAIRLAETAIAKAKGGAP